MMNIRKAVENIDSESKKVGYDPKIETNWCHLPIEIRVECMKHMGFKTRTRLRATSFTEKELVDSEKFELKSVQFTVLTNIALLTVRDSDGCNTIKTHDCHQAHTFMEKILELSEIPCLILNFCLKERHEFDEISNIFKAHVPRQLKVLSLVFNEPSVFPKFLECCHKIEKLFLGSTMQFAHAERSIRMVDIRELMEIPAVVNAKHIQLKSYTEQHFSEQIAQKWMEIDAEVGKTFIFKSVNCSASYEDFLDLYEDRVISLINNTVRFRTDNDAKHIIVRSERDSFTIVMGALIPADYPEDHEEKLLKDIKMKFKD